MGMQLVYLAAVIVAVTVAGGLMIMRLFGDGSVDEPVLDRTDAAPAPVAPN